MNSSLQPPLSLPPLPTAAPPLQQQKPQREDISIAFSRSTYATPYGDNSIPGNHPGYRHRRLGRRHAPDPINGGLLGNGLYVPSCRLGRHDTSHPADINSNVQHTLLSRDVHNSNYVLDAEHGGKRHFDERYGNEWRWHPSLRPLQPLSSATELRPIKGRACGMYNYVVPSLELQAMMAQREREAITRMAGKAIVKRPPDHHPMYLGLFHLQSDAGCPFSPDATAAGASSAHDALEDECNVVASADGGTCGAGDDDDDDGGGSCGIGMSGGFVPITSAFPSQFCNAMHTRGAHLITRRSRMAAPHTMKGSTSAAKHKQAEAAQARLEEIRLVQLLPK